MEEFYLHFEQTRTPIQIQLTNKLARALTDLNIQRIQKNKSLPLSQSHKLNPKQNRKNYLYVCFTGLPPFPEQFDQLGLDGEKIIVYPAGAQIGITQEKAKSQIEFAQIQHQILRIHNLLKERNDKPMVFIYHSFGTSLVSALLRFYYSHYVSKIIGMIAIGPYTIRASPGFQMLKGGSENLTRQFLMGNFQSLYDAHVQDYKSQNFLPEPNKYSFLCRNIAFNLGMGFKDMHNYIRQHPPVLKCFIYGREDNRIPQPYINQTAIYYTYKRKFQEDYEKKVKKAFEEVSGLKPSNIQERFIFNIDGGKHSIHIQKKFNKLLRGIIDEYLTVIQKIHSL